MDIIMIIEDLGEKGAKKPFEICNILKFIL